MIGESVAVGLTWFLGTLGAGLGIAIGGAACVRLWRFEIVKALKACADDLDDVTPSGGD